MTLYFNNTELEVRETEDSYRYSSLMGENYILLKFNLAEYIDIPVGAWCEFKATRYTLEAPANLKKLGERIYEYTLMMQSSQSELSKYKFRNSVDKRLKWSMNAKPHEFIEEVVANLNMRSSGWSVGTCIEASEKTIAFNHLSVDDALQSIANAFETEWEIANKVIHLRKVEYNKSDPLPLSYGKGNGFVPGVGRISELDKKPIDILFTQGGERNIDRSKYGSAELLLPKAQTLSYEGRVYISDEHGYSIKRSDRPLRYNTEDSLDCTSIYPKRVGTVNSVELINEEKNLYDIIDTSIPENLDFNDLIIEGETPTVIFQTGMLAGKEFEFQYKHDERRFELVPQEIDGYIMPGDVYIPRVNDTYAVYGIMLPDAYISDNATKTGASWDMFREAARYLYENEEQKFTFIGELQGLWAKENWLIIGGKLILGGYINFTDTQFAQEGVLIRITGVKEFLTSPYSPIIELSNSISGKSFTSTIKEIEGEEVINEERTKGVLQFTKRRFRDAKETMSLLENSFLNFDKGINPIFVQTMQLLVGDESLQFRFVSNKTNPVHIDHIINFDTETKILTANSGIIQHMTLGINTIKETHSASEYKFWDISKYDSPVLDQPDKPYYLYAKVSKESNSGTFLLSENGIKIESVAGYYHLLVGVLNSEFEGVRSFVALYGFTEILPGRITTDKIVSADGRTYIDLVNSQIVGKIRFLNENNEEQEIETVRLFLQYSLDGTNWHDTFQPTDRFMRQKNGVNGTWTDAISMGRDGEKGRDGVGVKSVLEQFYLSTSISTPTGGSWIDEQPPWEKDKYVFSRFKITYTDNSVSYTDPILNYDAEALAKANEAKAITDKFGTTIDGGLVQTVMMLLREANSETNTAGISGVQGALQNNPAFWAGGEYEQAMALIVFLSKMSAGTTPDSGEYADLAKITLLHNGAAKIGDFIIEESGRIVMVDPATGKARLVFAPTNIPDISELVSSTNDGGNVNVSFGNISKPFESRDLGGVINVTRDNSTIVFDGSTLNVEASSARAGHATVSAQLTRNGVAYADLGAVSVFFDKDTGAISDRANSRDLGVRIFNFMPQGEYQIRLLLNASVSLLNASGGFTGSKLTWTYTKAGVRYFQFGLDGMMAFFSNNHMHFTETNGLTIGGKTNMPGVLATASVTSNGSQINGWGAKLSPSGASIISGGFRVPLKDLTHNSYTVQATPHSSTSAFRITTKTNTYFEVQGSGSFDYTVIGKNYA